MWSQRSSSVSLADRGLAFGGALALALHREDTGDVVAYLLQSGGFVQLAGHQLEAQVEQLLLVLPQLLDQLGVAEVTQLCGLHHSTPSRKTNRHLTGSLCDARRIASRATSSGTPDSSNMTRPCLLYTSPSPRDGLLSR